MYERFAPQDPAGELDLERGIREFVVGTGGASHYSVGEIQPNSQVRDNTTFGVLKFQLYADGYDWEFIPVDPAGFPRIPAVMSVIDACNYSQYSRFAGDKILAAQSNMNHIPLP